MRYLFLCLAMMIGTTTQAVDLESYLNIYGDTRADLSVVDESVLFERIETGVFSSIDRALTDEEERSLIDTSVTSSLPLNVDPTAALSEVRKKYEFERRALNLEEHLLHEFSLLPALANESDEDSPFDLLDDLNLIDQLLFGAKWERSNPNFAIEGSELSQAQEDWQVGDPRAIDEEAGISYATGSPPDVLEDGERSIAAAIEDLMTYTQELNAKPLNLEYPTKRFFDTGQAIANVAETIRLTARVFSTPEALDLIPEVVSVLENTMRSVVEPVFSRYTTTDDRDFYSSLYTQQGALNSSELQQNLEDLFLRIDVAGIQRGAELFSQSQRLTNTDRAIEHLGLHLASIRDQALEIQETLELFYDKPDR